MTLGLRRLHVCFTLMLIFFVFLTLLAAAASEWPVGTLSFMVRGFFLFWGWFSTHQSASSWFLFLKILMLRLEGDRVLSTSGMTSFMPFLPRFPFLPFLLFFPLFALLPFAEFSLLVRTFWRLASLLADLSDSWALRVTTSESPAPLSQAPGSTWKRATCHACTEWLKTAPNWTTTDCLTSQTNSFYDTP